MNLINMISCRERAWSLLLLLLTSESCGAWETQGSFIVLLLPGTHDCRSSCLVLPGISLLSPGKQDIGSHLPDWSLRRTFLQKTTALVWCFPRLLLYDAPSCPGSHLTASCSARANRRERCTPGCSCVLVVFWGIPSWKLLRVLGRKSNQNATCCLLWAHVSLPELNKEGQASSNFTTAAAWCIGRPRVNFLKNDGEVSRLQVNRYNQEYLNINSSYWAEQRWRLLWGKGNLKWIGILAGPWWIILHWKVMNVHDGDRNIREDPTQTPFQCFFIF